MLKSEIGSFLYRSGISYHDYGIIKQGKKKAYDYFKTDKLTEEQKKIIIAGIPNCEFKTSSWQYAPELKNVLICIPVGKIPKGVNK